MTGPDDVERPADEVVRDLLRPPTVPQLYEYIAQITEELREMAVPLKDRRLSQLLEIASGEAGRKFELISGKPVNFGGDRGSGLPETGF